MVRDLGKYKALFGYSQQRGSPKGGRLVVEERCRDNDQGGTLCRVARMCQNTTPLFVSIHYAPYGVSFPDLG